MLKGIKINSGLLFDNVFINKNFQFHRNKLGLRKTFRITFKLLGNDPKKVGKCYYILPLPLMLAFYKPKMNNWEKQNL